MTIWQYRVITFNAEYETTVDVVLREVAGNNPKSSPLEPGEIIQSRLESMGGDGWELISLIPAQPTAQNWKGISAANPWMYHAIFKRPASATR